jgi:hypothetical protein
MLTHDAKAGEALCRPPELSAMTEQQNEAAKFGQQITPQAETTALPEVKFLRSRDLHAATLEAELLDSARNLHALRDRHRANDEAGRILDRCNALMDRAAEAARAGQAYIAWDCLQQIERERVPLLSEEQRRAELALVVAESRSHLDGWRQLAAEILATTGSETPGAAALQALLRNVHAARQERRLRQALVRRQLPVLTTMLVGTVLFFGLWGLLGGFDWLARDDVEITVGMMLVSGVLMGYFGGLVSFAFSWMRTDLSTRGPEQRTLRWLSLARPMIGAAVAVPIVLFFEAGLVNVGEFSPALVLALCFLGGFTERWFVARIDRLAGGRR